VTGATSAEWVGVLGRLELLADRRRLVEEQTARAVARAREAGVPWSMIGTALGVSRQAAHERYGPR